MKIVGCCNCAARPLFAAFVLTTIATVAIPFESRAVHAGSSSPSLPFPGLDVSTLDGMSLSAYYKKLRDLGFAPSWTYKPGRQSARYSKDFWCEKTWIVSWRVSMSGGEPVAAEVDITFINACE